jgi:hypothetical protein
MAITIRTLLVAALLLIHVPGSAQVVSAEHAKPTVHKFFDRENVALFSAVSVSRAMDCDSTWRVLDQPGGREDILPTSLARSRVQMSLFSAAMVGAQIGGSYLLHRAGWHRAERWSSAIHAEMVFHAAVNNYQLLH